MSHGERRLRQNIPHTVKKNFSFSNHCKLALIVCFRRVITVCHTRLTWAHTIHAYQQITAWHKFSENYQFLRSEKQIKCKLRQITIRYWPLSLGHYLIISPKRLSSSTTILNLNTSALNRVNRWYNRCLKYWNLSLIVVKVNTFKLRLDFDFDGLKNEPWRETSPSKHTS